MVQGTTTAHSQPGQPGLSGCRVVCPLASQPVSGDRGMAHATRAWSLPIYDRRPVPLAKEAPVFAGACWAAAGGCGATACGAAPSSSSSLSSSSSSSSSRVLARQRLTEADPATVGEVVEEVATNVDRGVEVSFPAAALARCAVAAANAARRKRLVNATTVRRGGHSLPIGTESLLYAAAAGLRGESLGRLDHQQLGAHLHPTPQARRGRRRVPLHRVPARRRPVGDHRAGPERLHHALNEPLVGAAPALPVLPANDAALRLAPEHPRLRLHLQVREHVLLELLGRRRAAVRALEELQRLLHALGPAGRLHGVPALTARLLTPLRRRVAQRLPALLLALALPVCGSASHSAEANGTCPARDTPW